MTVEMREGLPPDLKALLAAERRAPGPSAARQAQILARLAPLGDGAALAASGARTVPALASKLLITASVACAVGLGAVVVHSRARALDLRPPPFTTTGSARGPVRPEPLALTSASFPAPAPSVQVRAVRRRRSISIPPAESDLASLRAEATVLERARGSLASRDPDAALTTLAESEKRFPRGFLIEEREALWIRALAASGQRVAARERASAFARRFPASIQADAIAEALRDAER